MAPQLKPLDRPPALSERVYYTLRNRQLVRAIERYASHVQHLRRVTLSDRRVRTIALAGMKRISASLGAGDAGGAARAMADQLEAAKAAVQAARGGARGAGRPARRHATRRR